MSCLEGSVEFRLAPTHVRLAWVKACNRPTCGFYLPSPLLWRRCYRQPKTLEFEGFLETFRAEPPTISFGTGDILNAQRRHFALSGAFVLAVLRLIYRPETRQSRLHILGINLSRGVPFLRKMRALKPLLLFARRYATKILTALALLVSA